MNLTILHQPFTICQLAPGAEIPWAEKFVFVVKSEEELSLVCPSTAVPKGALAQNDQWTGFRIEGALDFSMIGVLAKLAGILAQADISILAVSSFNTDYVFVKQQNFAKAQQVLVAEGYIFGEQPV